VTDLPQEREGVRRHSFLAAAALTYGTNLAVAVFSLVNVLVVARALGPAGRGDVAFLIAIAILTGNLSAFGVQESNANIGGSEPRLRPALATNSLILALAFGAVAAGAVAGATALFPAVGGELSPGLLWIALGSIPAIIVKAYFTFLVQADYAFGVTNAAWLVGPSTTLVVNGLLAALGLITVVSATAAWVAGQALGAAILLVYVARHAGFGMPDAGLAARSLRFGLKTHIGRFMAFGNYRVDQWFIGAISGSRELGLYSVAVAWAEILFYVPGVLVMVQRPDLVRASPADAAHLAARVFRVALLLALVVAGILVVAAPFLCATVFGEEFRGSIDDLRVLALAAFGIVALELLGSALNAQRKPLLTTAAIGVAFVATIVLDLLLIPQHGGLGAAVATSAAWSAGGVAVALVFTRTLPARLRELVPTGSELPWAWRMARARFAQAGTGKERLGG
jgi:O-antigen/teichoic acid export membrane protein